MDVGFIGLGIMGKPMAGHLLAAGHRLFVFEPSLLMIGPWQEILHSFASATVGTICLASGLFGYLLRPSRLWERVLLVTAAILLIKPGLQTDLVGAALLSIVLFVQLASRREVVASAAQPPK